MAADTFFKYLYSRWCHITNFYLGLALLLLRFLVMQMVNENVLLDIFIKIFFCSRENINVK